MLAGVIGVEAVRRLSDPPDVEGGIVIAVGLLGAAVNLGAAWALAQAERRSLNVEGARAHVLTDLYASLGAALAGAIILTTGFREADPIAALVVSALMLRTAWSLLRESGLVLLEGTPRDLDSDAVGRALARHPGVIEVHDLHVWEVTSGFPALAAHVLVAPGDDCHGIRRSSSSCSSERFAIAHTTLQVDHEHADSLLEIEPPRRLARDEQQRRRHGAPTGSDRAAARTRVVPGHAARPQARPAGIPWAQEEPPTMRRDAAGRAPGLEAFRPPQDRDAQLRGRRREDGGVHRGARAVAQRDAGAREIPGSGLLECRWKRDGHGGSLTPPGHRRVNIL